LVTASIKESSASLACDFVTPASSAILEINSALFIDEVFIRADKYIRFYKPKKYFFTLYNPVW
jgi:hypothetical protein